MDREGIEQALAALETGRRPLLEAWRSARADAEHISATVRAILDLPDLASLRRAWGVDRGWALPAPVRGGHCARAEAEWSRKNRIAALCAPREAESFEYALVRIVALPERHKNDPDPPKPGEIMRIHPESVREFCATGCAVRLTWVEEAALWEWGAIRTVMEFHLHRLRTATRLRNSVAASRGGGPGPALCSLPAPVW